MSTWGIGDDHDTDEVQALKENLRNRDAQIATLKTQLLKRESTAKDSEALLNEVQEKLRRESDRTIELDSVLLKRTEELQNERVTRQNVELTLLSERKKLNTAEQTINELYVKLDTISSHANSSTSTRTKLEKENATLQAHVRELQADIAAKEQAELRRSHAASNLPQSPSASCVSTLERQAAELHAQMAQKCTELRETQTVLSQARDALVQKENEIIAKERQMQREVHELRSKLEEQAEELAAFGDTNGVDAAAREANLLHRIDEEERKVAALEAELTVLIRQHKREQEAVLDELERTKGLLREESKRAEELEAKLASSVAETESAKVHDNLGRTYVELDDMKRRNRELEFVNAEAAATVERLMGMVERLRRERDQARINLEFLSAESKFTSEDLKAKLAAATSVASAAPQIQHYQVQLASLHSQLAKSNQSAQDLYLRSARAAVVLACVVHHLQSERAIDLSHVNIIRDDLQAKDDRLHELCHSLEQKEDQTHRIQSTLRDTEEVLRATRSQLLEHQDVMARLQQENLSGHDANEDTRAALTQAQVDIANVMQALTDTEAQRDSLALELQHKQQDLDDLRNEMDETDKRHQQQLCAMSSGEPTRALRDEIQTLKDRVDRRTEQIGIQQHDIKRLETNMRLQEERLGELTSELEVMMSEKEAMVDDCRATREEREIALKKCEELEETIERLEEDVDRLTRERDILAQASSSAAQQQDNLSRELHAINTQKAALEAQLSHLQSAMAATDIDKTHASEEFARLKMEYESATQVLQSQSNLMQSASRERDLLVSDLRNAIVAFVVTLRDSQRLSVSHQIVMDNRLLLQSQIASTQQELQDKIVESQSLSEQLQQARDEHARAQADFSSHLASERDHWEQENHDLQVAKAELETLRQRDLEELNKVREVLSDGLADSTNRSQAEQQVREELEALRTAHSGEIGVLQDQLNELDIELAEAKRLHQEAAASQRDALASQKSMQDQLTAVTTELQDARRSQEDLDQLESQRQSELDNLHEKLDRASADLEETTRLHEELKSQHQQVTEQVEKLRIQVTDKSLNYEQLEIQLTETRRAHDEEMRAIQNRLDLASKELDEMHNVHDELDARYQGLVLESSQTQGDLENQLTSALEEVDYLKATLQKEMDLQTRDAKRHDQELHLANEQCASAEAARDKLSEELSSLRSQLNSAEASLLSVQEEKDGLQCDMTTLEAEIQRLKSLQRFLETQVKERETDVHSLKEDLKQAHGKCTQAEKACEAAETTLSMREIQHEQTLATLRRELGAMRANPKLEDKIAELEERNQEMEQLLKNKCMEIEENDDKFIEMLKEKKKLTSKIESLNRKVLALQTKLDSAKGPSAESTAQTTRPASQERLVPKSVPELPPLPVAASSASRPLPTPSVLPTRTFTTPNPHTSATSGPTPSRPKTPEARSQPAVFRPRTPESRRQSRVAPTPLLAAMPESSSSNSLGKKRRAPDDFEDGESLPPQGFTSESLPSVDNRTPRARRMLHPPRTGFTPMRNQAARPTSSQQSPSRRATTPTADMAPTIIADVTNSPRSKSRSLPQAQADLQESKTEKRGWLGKIRNVTGPAPQASRAASSRPPVFERRPLS